MSVRPYRDIERRKRRQIMVGNVPVGGDAPISVQSMTNTRTTDVAGTIAQIRGRLRLPVPTSSGCPALMKRARRRSTKICPK